MMKITKTRDKDGVPRINIKIEWDVSWWIIGGLLLLLLLTFHFL